MLAKTTTEIVALADFHAIVTEDTVGDRNVKREVRQHECKKIRVTSKGSNRELIVPASLASNRAGSMLVKLAIMLTIRS